MNHMTTPVAAPQPACRATKGPNPPRLPPGPMTAAAAMAPGTYLRLRRQKAGWTIDELALVLAGTPDDRPAFAERLRELEENPDHVRPIERTLRLRLAEFIDIDEAIYLALIGFAQDPDSGLPCPRICTGCGCTWNRACIDAVQMVPCHWREIDGDRCSTCPPDSDMLDVQQ